MDAGGPEPACYIFVSQSGPVARWKLNLSSGTVDLDVGPRSARQNLPNALEEQDRLGRARPPSWDETTSEAVKNGSPISDLTHSMAASVLKSPSPLFKLASLSNR